MSHNRKKTDRQVAVHNCCTHTHFSLALTQAHTYISAHKQTEPTCTNSLKSAFCQSNLSGEHIQKYACVTHVCWKTGRGGRKAKPKHSLGYCKKKNTCSFVQRILAFGTNSPLSDTHTRTHMLEFGSFMKRATGRRKAVPNVCGEEAHTLWVSKRLTQPTTPKSSAKLCWATHNKYACASISAWSDLHVDVWTEQTPLNMQNISKHICTSMQVTKEPLNIFFKTDTCPHCNTIFALLRCGHIRCWWNFTGKKV